MNNSLFILVISVLLFLTFPFKIFNSEKEKYYAGRRESGGGLNYRIKIIVEKPSKKLTFISLNIGEQRLGIKLCNSKGEIIQKFSKGDTLILCSSLDLTPEELQITDNAYYTGNAFLKFSYKSNTDSLLVIFKQETTKHYY